jgi:hypothetical protein
MKSTLMNRYGANTVPAFLSAVLTPSQAENGLDLWQNGKKWRKFAASRREFAA